MITALDETDKVTAAFEIGCEGYAVKPADTGKFLEVLVKLNLVNGSK